MKTGRNVIRFTGFHSHCICHIPAKRSYALAPGTESPFCVFATLPACGRQGWCGMHRQGLTADFKSIRRSRGILVLFCYRKRTKPPAAMSGKMIDCCFTLDNHPTPLSPSLDLFALYCRAGPSEWLQPGGQISFVGQKKHPESFRDPLRQPAQTSRTQKANTAAFLRMRIFY